MAKPATEWRWFKSFQYDPERDSASDTRNVLLIVAALITAVTFQAGVNPPGGVWQETVPGNHTAGTAIYASDKTAYHVFLVSNTMALSTAVLVIISLTFRFPFHFEIWVSTISMIITYGSSVFAITPTKCVSYRFILFTAAAPFLARFLWEVYGRWGRHRVCCCWTTFKSGN